MSFSQSFFEGIESELGRTPFVEAVEAAAAVIFDGYPEMEGIGDAVSGIGRKLGKAAAIGALALGAANAANSPGGHNGNGHSGHDGNGARSCEAQVRDMWNIPEFRELETRYLQEEMDLQQKQVASGKRAYVDKQRAYENAQDRAIRDVACRAK